jgi:hypothetical protein
LLHVLMFSEMQVRNRRDNMFILYIFFFTLDA